MSVSLHILTSYYYSSHLHPYPNTKHSSITQILLFTFHFSSLFFYFSIIPTQSSIIPIPTPNPTPTVYKIKPIIRDKTQTRLTETNRHEKKEEKIQNMVEYVRICQNNSEDAFLPDHRLLSPSSQICCSSNKSEWNIFLNLIFTQRRIRLLFS